jgi:hypothetical protein
MASRRPAEAGSPAESVEAAEVVGESAAEAGSVPTAVRLPSTRRVARPRCRSLLRLTGVALRRSSEVGVEQMGGTTAF